MTARLQEQGIHDSCFESGFRNNVGVVLEKYDMPRLVPIALTILALFFVTLIVACFLTTVNVMKLTPLVIVTVVALVFACRTYAIDKPRGTFSSSGASSDEIYANPNLRGVLIRASWLDIEPTPGVFTFVRLDAQVNKANAEGVPWSLSLRRR